MTLIFAGKLLSAIPEKTSAFPAFRVTAGTERIKLKPI